MGKQQSRLVWWRGNKTYLHLPCRLHPNASLRGPKQSLHMQISGPGILYCLINIYGFITSAVPLNCRGGCYFWLDPKVTKRSRQKKASTLPAGSYAFSALRALQRLNRHSRHTPGPLFCQAFARLWSFINWLNLGFKISQVRTWVLNSAYNPIK